MIENQPSKPVSRKDLGRFNAIIRVFAEPSPLRATVIAIDKARDLSEKYTGNLISNTGATTLDIEPHTARFFIDRSPNLPALLEPFDQQATARPDRAEFAKTAKDTYLDLLSSWAPASSKDFAVSKDFQDHVRTQGKKGEIGPYFVEYMNFLAGTNFVRNPERRKTITDVFTQLDNTYFWFEDYFAGKLGLHAIRIDRRKPDDKRDSKEVMTQAFEDFKAASNSLVKGLTDKENPHWRDFAIAALPALYRFIQFEHYPSADPYVYDGAHGIERAKALASTLPLEKGQFLLDYLWLTSTHQFDHAEKAFDDEIRSGNLERAEAYMQFAEDTYFSTKREKKGFMPYEEEFVWIIMMREFTEGKIALDTLKRTPEAWNKLRTAYFSLSPKARKSMSSWSEGVQEQDAEGKTTIEIALWNAIMTSPLLLEDPDLVAKVVAARFPPSRRNIQRFKLGEENPAVLKAILDTRKLLTKDDKGVEISVDDLIEDVLSGKLAVEQLPQLAQNTVALQRQAKKIYEVVPGKRRVMRDDLAALFRAPLALTDFQEADALLKVGVFPSVSLREFVRQHGERAFELLERLRQETARERFHPGSLPQRDIEYLTYLNLANKHNISPSNFSIFETLPFSPSGERVTSLEHEQRTEAEAAAFEAANLYWLIQEKRDLNRRVAVIGNQRYGAYFIAEPLRPFLQDIGVSVYNNYYVRSGGNNKEDLAKEFARLQALLKEGRFDDILIVDGTPSPYSGDTPRLPGSLGTYAEWLEENSNNHGYNIAHWVPQPASEINYGRRDNRPYNPPTNKGQEIILANPVMQPDKFDDFPRMLRNHKPGYLDDPERYSKTKQDLAFTEKGVELLQFGMTEPEFVNLVQAHMISVMPRYQRLAAK